MSYSVILGASKKYIKQKKSNSGQLYTTDDHQEQQSYVNGLLVVNQSKKKVSKTKTK